LIVNTADAMFILRRDLREGFTPIAVDTETTYTPSLADRRIIGISVATDNATYYIPVAHIEDPALVGVLAQPNIKEVPNDLFDLDRAIVFHNAKFDLQMLRQLDIKIRIEKVYDTMLMHHYIDEYPPHSLEELTKTRLGRERKKHLSDAMKRLRDIAEGKQEAIPAVGMAVYAESDARDTLDLFHDLWEDFMIYEKIWTEVDRPFMLVLLDTELKGLRVNLQEAQRQSSLAEDRMASIRTGLGFDPNKPSQLARKLFEVPPIGLGLRPPPAGKSNRPRMNEAFLTSVGHPITALVLEYRGLMKAKSSYFDSYLRLASRDDTENPRIHPSFKQHGTLTGRLSCENPNLQQIPRDSEVKKLFLPDKGFELWEFDYKTIELRLAAVYAKDENLLRIFREEGDVHQMVADQLGIDRHAAKTLNYAITYGAGVGKVALLLSCSPQKARDILDNFYDAYPGIGRASSKATDMGEIKGYIQLWGGRHRHFRWPSEAYKAFNAALQGGAFEIVKRAGILLHDAGYDLRNQVHDSWWVQLSPGQDRKPIHSLLSDWTEGLFGLRFTCDEKRLQVA